MYHHEAIGDAIMATAFCEDLKFVCSCCIISSLKCEGPIELSLLKGVVHQLSLH